MKIIGIDSSGLVASVALLDDRIVRAEYTTNFKKTHSQTLLPMIDEILRMTETDLSEVDAIAVAGGPGSFTGLRIGAATAKGFGLALDKPIVSVPTILGLAYNYAGASDIICPIMDARREQVYTGIYRFNHEEPDCLLEDCAIGISELIRRIQELFDNGLTGRLIFLGDGTQVYADTIREKLRSDIEYGFAPAHLNGQRAGAVATCAMSLYKQGKTETSDAHRPDYLRLSQAERERAEKEKK